MGSVTFTRPVWIEKCREAGRKAQHVLPFFSIGRGLGDGCSDLNDRFLQRGQPHVSRAIDGFCHATRLFSSIGLFFSFVSSVDTAYAIKEAVYLNDEPAIAREMWTEAEIAVDGFEKIVSIGRGILGGVKTIQHIFPAVSLPKAIGTAASALGELVVPLNAILSIFGAGAAMVDFVRIREVAKKMEQVQDLLAQDKVDQTRLTQLLNELLGVTEEEKKGIDAKVTQLMKKHPTMTKEFCTKTLHNRCITQKKALFAQATSKKALIQMEYFQRKTENTEAFGKEKAQHIFTKMRTLARRRLIVKVLEAINFLVMLGCCALFFTPVAPFVPLFLCVASELTGFALFLYERYGLEKGVF